MKIVCISDTHNKHGEIDIPECDILLHTGDFSSRGYRHEFENFVQWLDKQPAKHKIFISGNHDFICEKEPQFVKDYVSNFGVHYLFDSFVEIEGLKIYGSPWQPWFHDWAFNFERDDYKQAIKTWAKMPDDTDVLLTHGPPYRIMDLVARPTKNEDPNVGCKFLLGRVVVVKPKLHVFGHIHEQYGQLEYNGTLFVNAASCNLQYKPINLPTVAEL